MKLVSNVNFLKKPVFIIYEYAGPEDVPTSFVGYRQTHILNPSFVRQTFSLRRDLYVYELLMNDAQCEQLCEHVHVLTLCEMVSKG